MIICYILLVLSFFIVEGIPEKKSCFLQSTASPPPARLQEISADQGEEGLHLGKLARNQNDRVRATVVRFIVVRLRVAISIKIK